MNMYGFERKEQENLYFRTDLNENKGKHKSRLGRRKMVTHPITPAHSLELEAKQDALKDIGNICQEPNPALNDSFSSDSNTSTTETTNTNNLSKSFKTPGRSFYLPCIGDSPLNPLKGILDSPVESSRTLFFSPADCVKNNAVQKTLFGKATDADRSFGVSSLDDKKNIAKSQINLNYNQDLLGRSSSNSDGLKHSDNCLALCEPSPLKSCHLNSFSTNSSSQSMSCDSNKGEKVGTILQKTSLASQKTSSIGKANLKSFESHCDSLMLTPRNNCGKNDVPVKHSINSDTGDYNCVFNSFTSRKVSLDMESLTDMGQSLREQKVPQMRLCKTEENIPSSLASFVSKKHEASSFLKPIPGIDKIIKNISGHFSNFSSFSKSTPKPDVLKNQNDVKMSSVNTHASHSSLDQHLTKLNLGHKTNYTPSTDFFKDPANSTKPSGQFRSRSYGICRDGTAELPNSSLPPTIDSNINRLPNLIDSQNIFKDSASKSQHNNGSCLFSNPNVNGHNPGRGQEAHNLPLKKVVEPVDSGSYSTSYMRHDLFKEHGKSSNSSSAVFRGATSGDLDVLSSRSHSTPIIVNPSSVGKNWQNRLHDQFSNECFDSPYLKNDVVATPNCAAKVLSQYMVPEKFLSSLSSASSSCSSTPILAVDEVDCSINKSNEGRMKPTNLFQTSLLKNESSIIEGIEIPNNVLSRSSIFHSSIIKTHCEKEEPKNPLFPFASTNNDNHPRSSAFPHTNNNKVNSILKQDSISRVPDNRRTDEKQDDRRHSNLSRQPVKSEPAFKKPLPEKRDDVFKKPVLPKCVKQNSNLPEKVYVNSVGYPVLSLLGQGGSSKVYQALGGDSRLLAIKCVDLDSVDQTVAKGYLNEIYLLERLQCCPSVIRMFNHEYKEQNKKLLVVMEKGDVDFSTLIKSITKVKKISLPMIIYYWTEMLNCVNDIHSNGVIHSDLKPANFLLVGGRLKLIDFGIASPLQDDMTSVMKDVTAGTFNYMSPEAIVNHSETERGHKISYKSDIWSLGCILYQLLYGRTPYSHVTSIWPKMQAIADPKCLPNYSSNVEIPLGLQVALRWCLNKDPKKRPTTNELLEIPYYPPAQSSSRGTEIRSLLFAHVMEMFPHCPVNLE